MELLEQQALGDRLAQLGLELTGLLVMQISLILKYHRVWYPLILLEVIDLEVILSLLTQATLAFTYKYTKIRKETF